jgi:hypothetical protein
VNSVQSVDPNGRLLIELLRVLVLIIVAAILWLTNSVGVMRLIVKYEDVVCCESFIGDGGWSPEVGLQGQASNRHKLRG